MLQVGTSRDAGQFLCNYVYYRACQWVERNSEAAVPPACLFVHVPVASAPDGVRELTRIVLAVVRACLRQQLQPANASQRAAPQCRVC